MAKIHFNNETGTFIVVYASGIKSDELDSIEALHSEINTAKLSGKEEDGETYIFPKIFWVKLYDEEGNFVAKQFIISDPSLIQEHIQSKLKDHYTKHPKVQKLKAEEIMPCFKKCIGSSSNIHYHFYFDESSSDHIYSKVQAYALLEGYFLNYKIEIEDKVRMELQIDKSSLPHSIIEN